MIFLRLKSFTLKFFVASLTFLSSGLLYANGVYSIPSSTVNGAIEITAESLPPGETLTITISDNNNQSSVLSTVADTDGKARLSYVPSSKGFHKVDISDTSNTPVANGAFINN